MAAASSSSHDERLKQIGDRILWLDDDRFRELAAMSLDPVCGMAVETAGNPHLERDGTTWWFCSVHCHEEFADDPDRFLDGQARR